MGFKELVNSVKESLGLEGFEKSSKKKSAKSLLKKLENRKKIISSEFDNKPQKKRKKELQEELDIVLMHIKKTNKLLDKLNS